jgi:flagellar hook-basal body complex protein FliE
MTVSGITPVVPATPAAAAPAAPAPAAGDAFIDSLGRLIETTDASGDAANRAVEQMLDGRGEVHDAMIALQRAELSLQFTVQVRNKLVQAYQDIMRMSV